MKGVKAAFSGSIRLSFSRLTAFWRGSPLVPRRSTAATRLRNAADMSPAFSLPSLDPKPGTDRRLVRRRFPEHFRFWVRGALFSHGPEASVLKLREVFSPEKHAY